MNKEDKKRVIINHLINNSGYIKANELSELLSVSSKSIYRLINEINDNTKIRYIFSERGKGFYINPELSNLTTHEAIFSQNKGLSMSPIERRNEIVKDLLINSPYSISVNHIINKFFISESMLGVDEKHIIESLHEFNLQLIRKNRTLAITGEESNIRMALMEYMDTLYIDIEKTINIPKNREEKDMDFVNKQINIIEKTLNVNIPYPYNVNIISHLYILILRFRKHGKHVEKEHKLFDYSDPQIEQSYYRVCDIIIKNFETYLSSSLPNIEKNYLYRYLTSYRIEHVNKLDERPEINFSNDIVKLSNKLIETMESNLNYDFSNNQFRIDLMKHIKPMSNRLKNNIIVKNKLLDQIKFEYPEIHSQTSIATKNIIPSISEDEIGFLTLYFAREIERNPRKIKTLITCTTGIGTSELLRVKIEKNIPEIEVVDVISSDVIESKVINDIDLIVSTIALPNFNMKPVIVISAMFNKNDQEKLKNFIQR
ncbi:PRD domain-containing protein [Staphylococcus nepalensis]|uniref:PRD domain-containing protein n=1 Tax=Staphylococcus nepalensis TaxID=214473 RepID=A0ABS3L412_9STAP|nr:PRD domain-containing protein [Staphylococcus nepalensis]MBO1214801.1 PRD domain-containing protein [Staphylococcus nepalensis]MBO1217442.1 PRD domain-containing protein [Staphylococcus nepalensis]MBO1228297.1 PRD domain-containing protein [Staphylococcus nepalensis]MBO1236028.1 PRD domain-containing protein [Staphylococcus nepalensis]